MIRSKIVALGLVVLLLPAGTVLAGETTARASGVVDVYDSGFAWTGHVIDRLKPDERVYVLSCTRHKVWCEIRQLDGGPTGWVDGSYIIGEAAKNLVTPFEFSVSPFDPIFRPRKK